MDKPSSFQNGSHNVAQDTGAVNSPASKGGRGLLVRAAGVMGLMTLASRVLGMARDIVCARAFGTTWQWDAFVYAFMLPNFFRRLVGEGALSSAFVPVYSETLEKQGRDEAFRFANVMLTIQMAGFAIFLILIETVLFFLLKLDIFPERLRLIFDYLRFFFPYLAFMSMYGLGMGVLNSHGRFFGPAIGPVILNAVWIAGVWIVMSTMPGAAQTDQLRVLSVIILFSALLQVAFELPYLVRIGFRPAWIWNTLYPGLVKTMKLLGPVVIGFAVMQINLMIDMTLSFWVGPGANSSLWYGNRLMQLPMGVFAVAVGTALLPAIARQVAGGQHEEAKKNLSFSLRSIAFIVIPCAAGLIALAGPIVEFLFQRGEFDAESTRRTAAVLVAYSLGLFAYSGQKIITSGFYALQDTRTPVKIAVAALAVNFTFNIVLMQFLAEAGLALATSISGIVQFILLMFFFHKRVTRLPMTEILVSFGRILLASAAMGVFAAVFYRWTKHFLPGGGTTEQGIRVLGTIALSAVLYVPFCFVLRVREMGRIFQMAGARLFPARGGGAR